MRVGALGGEPEHVGGADIGREIGAAYKGCPGASIGSLLVAPAQAEFEHEAAAPTLVDACSFGGNKGLVVEMAEERSLEDLGHDQRALDHGKRDVGMDDASLGDGVRGDALKVPRALQPGQKVILKDRSSCPARLPAQVLGILATEARSPHPVQEPLHSRVDAVSRLVGTVIGVAAEEVIELHLLLVQAHPEV